jgi:hypothetical protein
LNGGQAKELLINTSELHQQPVTIETQVPGKKNEGTSLSSAQNTDRVHLFWLQQKHTVNDQDFDPFLILGGWKEEILTSSRIRHDPWNASMPIKLKWVAANKFELVTIIAALLGLAGFILQFEGLRGLAWPTAVTQLLAIFIMAFIRALIRRRLGEHLSTIPASEGHELDWLALRLVYTSGGLDPPPRYEASDTPKTTISWELMTPSPEWNDTPDNKSDFSKDGTFQNSNDTSSKSRSRLFVREGEIQTVHKDQESVARNSFIHANFPSKNSKGLFPSTSQMALKVRRRLGELTHCPGAASKEAIALAQAISLVLTELQPIRDNTTKIFTWYLETNITISNIVSDPMVSAGIDPIPMRKKPKSRDASQAEPEFESGENLITLQVRGNKHGWRAHAPDMDAILSLWMSSIANSPSITVPEDHPGQPDWLTKMASATIKYRRILGENPCHYNPTSSRESLPRSHYHIDEPFPINTDILTRDLNWWTNDPRIAALSIKNHDGSAVDKEPLEKPSTGTISLNIGFHGLQTQRKLIPEAFLVL